MVQVGQRELPKQSGLLSGFKRCCVKDDSYPVIFRNCSTDLVEGTLYRDISNEYFAILDTFEEDYYSREAVEVRSPDNSVLQQLPMC